MRARCDSGKTPFGTKRMSRKLTTMDERRRVLERETDEPETAIATIAPRSGRDYNARIASPTGMYGATIRESQLSANAVNRGGCLDHPAFGPLDPGGGQAQPDSRPGVALSESGQRTIRVGPAAGQGGCAAGRKELAAGQRPIAAVLSCADSRVPPRSSSTRGWVRASWSVWPATSANRSP